MNPRHDATATVEFAVRPPPPRIGPILIAFDGTPASEYALWEAGRLLAGRRALVVTVWKPGLAFEFMELPTATLGLPPAQLDVRTALEVGRQAYEAAQQMAERGAALAREVGFDVEGLAVAEDLEVTIAETIRRVALENDSEVIAVGIEGRGRLGEVLLGSTPRDIIRRAPCPVLVARMPPEKKMA
jgi:nucleotide-binding universal stress UspA family protein